MKINSDVASKYMHSQSIIPSSIKQMDKKAKYRIRPVKDILDDDRVNIPDKRPGYIHFYDGYEWRCSYITEKYLNEIIDRNNIVDKYSLLSDYTTDVMIRCKLNTATMILPCYFLEKIEQK